MKGFDVATKELKWLTSQIDYKKRTVRVMPTTSVRINNLNWDSGSKSVFHAVNLVSKRVKSMSHWVMSAPWSPEQKYRENAVVDLIPGFAVVETGWFMGKPSKAYLYVHPDDVTKYLTKV